MQFHGCGMPDDAFLKSITHSLSHRPYIAGAGMLRIQGGCAPNYISLTLPLKLGHPSASAYHALSLRLLSLIHIRPLKDVRILTPFAG
jgi:hypothetical protein